MVVIRYRTPTAVMRRVLRKHIGHVTAALVLGCSDDGEMAALLVDELHPRVVVAVDPNSSAIDAARRRFEPLPIYFVAGDFLAPGLWHNAVNVVLVLDEIPDNHLAAIAAGPLNQGGHLVSVHAPKVGIGADLNRMRMTAAGVDLVEQIPHDGQTVSVYRTT